MARRPNKAPPRQKSKNKATRRATRAPTKPAAPAAPTAPAAAPQPGAVAVSVRPAGWTNYLLPGFVVAVLALVYAEPLLDGDLFWHLAYAQQMLANTSLRPDAALYSWTPADGSVIYVAWLAELLLHGVWTQSGLAGLFALRYAVIAAIVALFVIYARRRGVSNYAGLWLGALFIGLTARSGSLIKPEFFSLLFLHAVIFGAFLFKHRAPNDAKDTRFVYALPVLMVVWVNCHGAFVYAAPLLGAIWLGEALNRRLSPALGLSRESFKHLTIAIGACALAVMINPYGPLYPWQLFADYVLGATPRPDVIWNNAYRSIFDLGWSALLFALPIMVGAALLAVLIAQRIRLGRPLDWTLILLNLAALPFYLLYIRSMFVWPAVLAYSIVHLATEPGVEFKFGWRRLQLAGRHMATLALAALMILGGRSTADAIFRPTAWLGFGVGPINPVVEAEYLARAGFGPRLYNIFDSGGYLLWRLYPRYKVMTDSRSFPYLSWFADQYDFATGKRFDSFVEKYPGDVAVIDLEKVDATYNFLKSDAWQLIFYGQTAAIFARKDDTAARPDASFAADRFDRLPSGAIALRVYDFAGTVGDHKTAWLALEQLEGRLGHQVEPASLAAARAFRQAHRALAERRFDDAEAAFRRALAAKPIGDRNRLIALFLSQRSQALKEGAAERVRINEEALVRLALPGA